MKIADLALARLSIPESVPAKCCIDDCSHHVGEIVNAVFPDLASRRVCLCVFHAAQLRAIQASKHACGQWPEPPPTFKAAPGEGKP